MAWASDAMGVARELAGFARVVGRQVRASLDSHAVDNLPLRLAAAATRWPQKSAIVFEGREVTWAQLDDRVGRVARALQAEGVSPGDSVSLLMENSISFVECLLGAMRAGTRVALINTNLTGAQLAHCVKTAGTQKLIFGSEFEFPVSSTRTDFGLRDGSDFFWVAGDSSSSTPDWAVDLSARSACCEPIPQAEVPPVRRSEHALLVFTSGTTGLPKAAIQPHHRLLAAMDAGTLTGLKLRRADVLYLCLPLYHATGLLVGLAPAIQSGATVVLRRRFSASHFLDEVREHDCNAFVYVGELCRYLLAQPERADDAVNPLVKMIGNGLRPDIWMAFKRRFAIPRIIEFYGASEGNAGFMNLFNRDCTIGVGIIPPTLVEYDLARGDVVRDPNGRCRRVSKGSAGLLLGRITRMTAFEGYTDSDATESKILRNVFKEGDAYFNSGDLIREIDAGFAFGLKHYQFVDRVGDTFRWKGENCSTIEVGEIINRHPSVQMCNVYGVTIPATDGRAGMAAVLLRPDVRLDIGSLSSLIQRDLASYARPVFLRIMPELPLTGTLKMQKGQLVDAAFHLDRCPDPIYVLRPGSDHYELLDDEFYREIMNGRGGF